MYFKVYILLTLEEGNKIYIKSFLNVIAVVKFHLKWTYK